MGFRFARMGHPAIVRAKPDKARRIVAQIRITQLTGHGKHNDDIIDIKEGHLPDGWTTITPSART